MRFAQIWRLDTLELVATLSGHTDGVNTLALVEDGTKLVSGSHDKTIRVRWRTAIALRNRSCADGGGCSGPSSGGVAR